MWFAWNKKKKNGKFLVFIAFCLGVWGTLVMQTVWLLMRMGVFKEYDDVVVL